MNTMTGRWSQGALVGVDAAARAGLARHGGLPPSRVGWRVVPGTVGVEACGPRVVLMSLPAGTVARVRVPAAVGCGA